VPSWFNKFVDGQPVTHFKGARGVLEVKVDPAKQAILDRIFRDILTLGGT
jgi:hypothetical protein